MPSEYDLSGVLSEFASTMVTDFPLQEILDQLMARIVTIMPVSGAGVTLVAHDSGPEYVAASSDEALRFEQLQTGLGDGPSLLAYGTGEAVALVDLGGEHRFAPFVSRALEAGLAAMFSFPLRHGGSQLGALDLFCDTAGPLPGDAMAAGQTLADIAAAYLINAQARADLQRSSDQSRHAALHDGLTGLPNRVLLLERLEHAILRGRSSCRPPAVLFVDLDDFKNVNDTYGHRSGDELLIAVAERATGLLRPGDTLARLSGDEFVVVCEDAGTPVQGQLIARRLRDALARPFVLTDMVLSITASIGITCAERYNVVAEQVLRDADLAMYRARRKARGGVANHDLREQHLADHQAALERSLDEAVGRGELHLEYQPIVGTVDGHVAGIEALVRWQHPSRGLVSPSVFIPMAEQSGVISGIGHWVLEQAWTDRGSWTPRHGLDDVAVSVNVSAHELMSPGFVDTVTAVLENACSESGLLTLEITEGVFVRDGQRALMVLHDLKARGVRIALDDFGTGYLSLSSLMRFPVDVVKIDGALVANLGRDRASRTVVASVIQLAHDLGMTVVAEGVETADQHRELHELGCDYCQGYHFGRPTPIAAFDALVPRDPGQTPVSVVATHHNG